MWRSSGKSFQCEFTPNHDQQVLTILILSNTQDAKCYDLQSLAVKTCFAALQECLHHVANSTLANIVQKRLRLRGRRFFTNKQNAQKCQIYHKSPS